MPSSACKKSALRSEEHTSELQSPCNLVCRLLLEKNNVLHPCLRVSFREVAVHPSAGGRPPRSTSSVRMSGRGSPCSSPEATSMIFSFFNDTATTEIYPLSLHDALPIWGPASLRPIVCRVLRVPPDPSNWRDRKSTRLNSSHLVISYAVFCLKKKGNHTTQIHTLHRCTFRSCTT